MKNFIKNLLIISSFILAPLLLNGQSSFAVERSQKVDSIGTSSVAANTLWFGSKLAHNFRGDVSGSFLFDVRSQYILFEGDNFSVPIMGNLGVGQADTLSSDKGGSFGVYPWVSVYKEGDIEVVLHGGFNYQILDLEDPNSVERVKFLAGAQVAVFSQSTGLTTIFSATPAFIKDLGPSHNSLWGLELSGIIPVADNYGLLLESLIPLDDNLATGVGIGLIFNIAAK